MTRAKVPDQATRMARAEQRAHRMNPAEKMALARAKVRPGSRTEDAQTGRARTMALPPLSELELTADEMADEVVSVSQAAELLEISQQAINQAVVRGSLPAFQHEGQRAILLDDLAASRAGRAQAARLADERHRLDWLGVHLAAEGECSGAGCLHWTHEGPADMLAVVALLRWQLDVRRECDPVDAENKTKVYRLLPT
jgi:hypothetical protein